ncbi:MAG: hypothetical protein ACFFAN_17495, partial [Promethearchaeota archaeon]
MKKVKTIRKKKKWLICLFIISSLLFPILFILNFRDANISHDDDSSASSGETTDKDEEEYTFETVLLALDPNFTRTNYPVILSNETAEDLWLELDEHHVDNIRIAYYSMDNQWELVSFQLDEKAYFRRFKYEQGSQASLSGLNVEKVDISNWGHYIAEHRYAGKDIDAQPGDPYKEPTQAECVSGFWATRLAEGWDDVNGDATKDPGSPLLYPYENDTREEPGGVWDQHEHRIDYDDELVFYAQNGKKVETNNWWNTAEYPKRTEIHIIDPVDGGQTWMYLYYNDEIGTAPPTTNYFIPPGDEDLVDWNSANLKVSGENYEIQLDPNNKDLLLSSTVKLPGETPITISTEGDKQWIAINLHIRQTALDGALEIFNVEQSGDIWREGEWLTTVYNEQTTSIGYGITMDLDLKDLPGYDGDWAIHFPGQDTDYSNGHRTTGLGGQSHDAIPDTYSAVGTLVIASYDDDADHDGVTSDENAPFLRGIIDHSGASNEAAIDGPCRVILHRTMVQVFGLDMQPIDPEGAD